MKKFILPFVVLTLLFSTVHADVAKYSVDINGRNITVKGTVDESGSEFGVALTVLKSGKSFSGSTAATDVEFLKQLNPDASESDFEFAFELPIDAPSNPIEAVLVNDDDVVPITINYVTASDFDSAVSGIDAGDLASSGTFSSYLDEGANAYLLGTSEQPTVIGIPAEALKTAAREIMYESVKANPGAVLTDPQTAKNLWDECVLIALINNDLVSDISDYAEYVDISDNDIEVWLEHVLTQEGAAARVTTLLDTGNLNINLSGGVGEYTTAPPYTNIAEFEKELKAAIVLAVVEYPNGSDNIGLAMSAFSEVTGITSSNETAKYSDLAGDKYADIGALLNAYAAAGSGSDGGSDSGSDGGVGGGTGGSGSSGGTGLSNVGTAFPSSSTEVPTVGMKFIDLDTVPWAYEAISTLFDKGIIAGREETLFMPNDLITREEFVKLCVMIMGLEDDSFTNIFKDVNFDDWFCKYVNIATKNGLCQGTGNGEFGVGANIKREDIAVILNNVLKEKDVIGDKTDAGFADEAMIDGYAKDAVNVLVNHGIINGVGDNMFAPQSPATRAEAAKMLFGVWELIR